MKTYGKRVCERDGCNVVYEARSVGSMTCSKECALIRKKIRDDGYRRPKPKKIKPPVVIRRPTARDISRSPGCIELLGEPE